MKKINRVCLLILLMAVTLLFAGCEILEQPFPIGTEADSGSLLHPEKTDSEATGAPVETPAQETEAETADPYEGLSSAARQIREIADKALRAKYDIPSLEHFSVEVTDFSDSYSVRYVLMIHGYENAAKDAKDSMKCLAEIMASSRLENNLMTAGNIRLEHNFGTQDRIIDGISCNAGGMTVIVELNGSWS